MVLNRYTPKTERPPRGGLSEIQIRSFLSDGYCNQAFFLLKWEAGNPMPAKPMSMDIDPPSITDYDVINSLFCRLPFGSAKGKKAIRVTRSV
jgi:hypothetical protein